MSKTDLTRYQEVFLSTMQGMLASGDLNLINILSDEDIRNTILQRVEEFAKDAEAVMIGAKKAGEGE